MLSKHTRYPVLFGLGMAILTYAFINRETLFLQNIEEQRLEIWTKNIDPKDHQLMEKVKAKMNMTK